VQNYGKNEDDLVFFGLSRTVKNFHSFFACQSNPFWVDEMKSEKLSIDHLKFLSLNPN